HALAARGVCLDGPGEGIWRKQNRGEGQGRSARNARPGHGLAQLVLAEERMSRMRSVPDSAIHASPLRPSSWRTLAPGLSLGKLSKVSDSGSKRTTALAAQSVSHTLSSGSTHTA